MNFKRYFENKKLNEVLTEELTMQEFKVISLIATGAEVKSIAKILNIGICTVKFHMKNFKLKLIAKTDRTNLRVAITNFYWSYYKEILQRVK